MQETETPVSFEPKAFVGFNLVYLLLQKAWVINKYCIGHLFVVLYGHKKSYHFYKICFKSSDRSLHIVYFTGWAKQCYLRRMRRNVASLVSSGALPLEG